MRVTREAKAATRDRILRAAAELFRSQGFDAATTRDIAAAAHIATGTLFNYFRTKDDIVVSLAAHALHQAHQQFEQRDESHDGFSEALFAYAAAELRALKPFRKYIQPMLDTVLCPLAAARCQPTGEEVRQEHLEAVTRLAYRHGLGDAMSSVAIQLYWTLYTGVLAFWVSDKSPKQEDTLALLDESLNMFAGWIQAAAAPER